MASEIEFTGLIQEHQGLLFKVASIYTNSTLDRDDLFQEIVYQLWISFDSFRGDSKITTWMYRVGMNTAIAHLKKAKRSAVTVPLSAAINLGSVALDELQEERLKLLHLYIQQLNTLEKGLMFLLLEGKSYQEIAEIIGLTSSNVGTRISRIKKKLKSNMIKS